MRLTEALGLSFLAHALLVAVPSGSGQRATLKQGISHDHFEVRLSGLRDRPLSPSASDESRVGETPDATDSKHVGLIPTVMPDSARYYKSSEVDKGAEPIETAPLVFPEQAYRNRTKGTVRLRIFIDRQGNIDQVDMVAVEPPGIFEQSAIDAVLGSHFTPAQKQGVTVKSVKEIEITFDPYESIRIP